MTAKTELAKRLAALVSDGAELSEAAILDALKGYSITREGDGERLAAQNFPVFGRQAH